MALNVLPAEFNYQVPQAADFEVLFEYDDSWDLTGYTAESNWYVDYGDVTSLQLTSAGGGITIDLTEKEITLIFADTDTSALTDYEYIHSLVLTDSSNKIDYVLKGHVTLIRMP